MINLTINYIQKRGFRVKLSTTRREIQDLQRIYETTDLIEMIEDYKLQQQKEKYQKRLAEGRVGKFYPSSAGQCKRKIVYQMTGVEGKPPSAKGLMIMDNGTYFHKRMNDWFEEMGLLVAKDLPLKHEELRISGECDAIIWNFRKNENDIHDEFIQIKKDNEIIAEGYDSDFILVDFKSINSKAFYYLKDKPKPEHELQLQLYLYLTGIRKGMMYYESKDTQETKYYFVDYNQTKIDKLIDDIQYIIRHVDEETVPDRDFEPSSWQCKYCDYFATCYEN